MVQFSTKNLNYPYECMTFSEKYRDAIATHKWFEGDEKMKSGYYLNDGRGTLQGFIC